MEVTLPLAAKPFEQDIQHAVEILKSGGCSEVFLFGSLAEGRAHEHSDIDLAVRGCPTGEFFPLFGELMFELHHSVDLIDLDAPDPFAQFLLQHGVLKRVG
ncbi:MAG: nucleotidyltransferase domain-containing protein [Acidobacteria bacterium]|nr:nucleotidyltransferase domain-containing protein [Acidobacteriota bacterium]MBI3424406.1 nucleotidyltransferase domain-containing protein [Acidobacteriota bacterium]